MRLHPSASMEVPRRRNRPAHSRREQALRAEARTASRLLRGLAQLQMEGHEARLAIAALNGSSQGSEVLNVRLEEERKPRGRR